MSFPRTQDIEAVIASASEAIHFAASKKAGLLRFARNDGQP
jgi:hypothetical protein